ncbi:hypothetical protein AVEN_235089-1 [Araneus ventricosus]|uniref:Borealin C-terminal domain-containing protein n=1 Tax=Araneus ventricosus TaxID=182803 RepID=A0A4Y2RJX1_ARAVE|nr:hypothetical protein AVEN_245633-1 [Araneus ventricosus]GBN75730.1 hypothetical protein AVEN_125835-1 [Araneus ventricosus]GBN78122.1 hypothetical protein AVEN_203352-1 [Araneus ventricosus]GBN78138.1 hypothetical protein AVEN_235089-1 [Araneus ventricosus]
MVKRKVKKTKKITDPVVEEKLKHLKNLKEFVNISFSEYETYLLGLIEEKGNRVKKLYADKLKLIPDNIKHMTITQIMEQEQKDNCVIESSKKEDAVQSVIESGKMMSAKKKTLKKEKKRSVSANASARPLAIPRPPTNTFSRLSRTLSESALSTPLRSNRLSNMVVTPKFNPKLPLNRMARIPKPGELVMSMSGSPLQNIVGEGKVTLSLGGGKVLQLSEDTDLEKELKAEIDEPLKKTIKNLREQLDKILQA